jgi:hypothetical protein
MDKIYQGAKIDERPAKEKEKDYIFAETVAKTATVNWVEKEISELRKFPIFNQDGSGSCVAQTCKKELGILHYLDFGNYIHYSATDIYNRRFNKPDSGMSGNDARRICQDGVSLESLIPSTDMTDEEMDNAKVHKYNDIVRTAFKVRNYVTLPIGDIDTIASIIQETGKGVMVWFYFEYNEWTDVPEIKNESLSLSGSTTCRHSLTATDFLLYKGKKALFIEDSWGPTFGLEGRRIITEDFFKERNFYASYLMDFKYKDVEPEPDPVPDDNKPKHNFTKQLHFSPNYNVDEDVKRLQDILKYEGLFPLNIACTGYYGSITSKGVYKWQIKHEVADKQELDALGGRSCGPKTIAKLNELYS